MEAAKDTIRDTTYIKSDSVFIENKVIEKVTPSWCYIAIYSIHCFGSVFFCAKKWHIYCVFLVIFYYNFFRKKVQF